jgi:hypothetical protein
MAVHDVSLVAALVDAAITRARESPASLVALRRCNELRSRSLTAELELSRITLGTDAWLARRAWQFGFVISYPKGERSVSCYHFEPWRERYFGRPRAAAIHESGLVAREWPWGHLADGAP